MNDSLLERWGIYFVYHKIQEKYGITFERFIEMCQQGVWQRFVQSK